MRLTKAAPPPLPPPPSRCRKKRAWNECVKRAHLSPNTTTWTTAAPPRNIDGGSGVGMVVAQPQDAAGPRPRLPQ
jgi:hypothetical protein